ncbi:uncharacterized protein [Equus caballus]|uniref:uncharacterized protein n=1 Tax=Equus caballus TaxID=9796 RepID=UPI0038B414AB
MALAGGERAGIKDPFLVEDLFRANCENRHVLTGIAGKESSQEFKFIKDIKLVQKAANLYTMQPDEHFGAWLKAVEPLSEEASYSLSCQLEPRYQWTRKIPLFFKDKKSHSSSRPGLKLTPAERSRPGAAPPTLPRGSERTGRTLGAGAGPPCSASWTQRRLWTEHAHPRPPRRLRARARALASRSWLRDLRSGRAPGGSRAAVPPGLPRFGGLSDEPPRPEMFKLERHFPEGSGHARSLASIPFSRGSPFLQALDSLCSFPVEESQGGLISFGRCRTMGSKNVELPPENFLTSF